MKLMKLFFLILLIAIFFNSILFGAYVTNQPITLKQPDGTTLNVFASGDEFYNWSHDKDGYTIVRDRKGWYVYAQQAGLEITPSTYVVGKDNPASKGIQPFVNKSAEEIGRIRKIGNQFMTSHGEGKAPHSGTLNNIVIFIRFSDQAEFTEGISTYSSMFNGTSGNTMQNYFSEASYNQLNITTSFYPVPGTIVVSWQDSHPRAYYSPYDATTNPTGYQGGANGLERTTREHTLLKNAVTAVGPAIPTSLNIDGDNDGKVDNVCFIIQGNSDGWAELLWPHRWSLYSYFSYINGKRVYDYNFQLSLFMASRGVGVLCHEMFHSLGSPDLYHYTTQPVSPVGSWDIMESDQNPPQHMGAYMKFKYGLWISSIPVISTPGTYTLNSLATSTNNCYKIASPNAGQYFVLEYRKKTGTFESSVPNSGLLVYRINTAASGNSNGPPDEVYVYRPNGTTTVNGEVSNAYFSSEAGRTLINNYTNPKPYLYDDSNGNLNLMNIGSSAGNSISFTYTNQDPLSDLDENFENGFASLPWSFSGNAVWTIDTTQYYNGVKSAKSGTITHNQSSIMQITVPAIEGQVSFFYKVSSESNYDYLKFYIDGVLKSQWSGEVAWSMTSFSVTAGDHILKWEYMKDGSVTTGSDCAWVDYIAWPNATFNPPQNLSAVASVGMVTLNWQTPVSGTPTSYKIYRNGSLLTTLPGLAYTDLAVVNGTPYSYYVTAGYVNPTGVSASSNTVNVTPVNSTSITIGTETTVSRRPITNWYGFERSANLFLESEVPFHGSITNLSWYPTVATTAAIPTKIYLKTVTVTNLTEDIWSNMTSGATLVYNASIPAPAANTWLNIDIADYAYAGGNVLVLVECNYTGSGTGSSAGSGFRYSLSASNMVEYWQRDNTDPTDNGTLSNQRPNIQITMGNISSTPGFSANPSAVDFSMVPVNTSTSAQTITISNTGGSTLTISGIIKTGTNPANFILTDSNTYPKTLIPGQNMSISVAFSAAGLGLKSAIIRITDTQAKQVHDVTISGTSYDPTITTYPYNEGFETAYYPPLGWLNLPVSPSTQAFDLQSTGTYPTCSPHGGTYMVRYNSFNIQTDNSAYLASPPLQLLLNKDFRVKFWMYRDSGYSSTADSINVYFNTTQNLTGATLLGTIHRTNGMTPIVTADGWYEYSFDFPVNQGNNIRYVLLSAGSKYGNNIFLDDITIEEVILLPIFSVNQTDIDFGCVNLGDSNTLPFTISNTGTASLSGSITSPTGFTVSAAAKYMKTAESRNSVTYNIAPGSSSTFNLQFTPSIAGLVNSEVTISSNDSNHSSTVISVHGIGFTPPQSNLNFVLEGFQLSWPAVTGATGYNIYYSNAPNSSFSLLTTVSGTSYSIPTDLRTGFYKITAISELPKSDRSSK
jgi:M6 family metalloprotease-like protein